MSTSTEAKAPARAKRRGDTLRFVATYFAVNLQGKMEYRTSFVTQVLAMFLNNGIWIAFWALFFTQFPVVAGWGRLDVISLWAVLAFAYGLVYVLFFNVAKLARLIAEGGLDVYLLQPKDVLLHVLISDMSAPAIGDVLFGLVTYLVFVPITPLGVAGFLLGSVIAFLIFLGFGLLVGSLAFYLGNAQNIAGHVNISLLHFSTYPTGIFDGAARIILFTLIPAGFVSLAPVRLIRTFDPVYAVAGLGFGLALLLLAVFVFRRGLRRYETGNLTAGRL